MNSVDGILLVIIGFFLLWGYFRGIIKMLGGFVVVIVAGYLAVLLSDYIAQLIASGEVIAETSAVPQLIFYVVFALLFFLGSLLINVLDLFSNLPVVGSLKRNLGALAGLVQGLLVAGFAAMMISKYPFFAAQAEQMTDSWVAPVTIRFVYLLYPLWSQDWKGTLEKVVTQS